MSKKIKKAIFPVAGLGTRFLPATKSMPKEMLTVVDKPLIHYAVEEAAKAGIEEFIFITGKGKTAIEDYFDSNLELEYMLKKSNKSHALDALKEMPRPEQFTFVRQHEQLGLGHAVWCARKLIDPDEPFAVMLSDVLVLGEQPCIKQMVDAHEKHPGNIISVEEIPVENSSKYGIVDVEEKMGDIFRLKGMVEKPSPEEAPSNLAVTGRYILHADVFDYLDQGLRGAGGEIQLTDAIANEIGKRPVYAFKYEGVRYDCGGKPGFLEANIAYALTREDLREDMVRILETYNAQVKRQAA